MKKLMIVCMLLVAIFGFASSQPQDIPPFTGAIAYIGGDSNVYTAKVEQGEVLTSQLTNDATIRRHYQFPTWSTDGRLAYFCCDPRFSGRSLVEVYITEDSSLAGKNVYQQQDEVFTYANWSPQNCDQGENCRYLAVLLGGNREGFKVELIRESGSWTAGTGSPFYFSWSPDGEEMLWQRNNQRVDVFSVLDNEISIELESPPGLFPAPMWSPVDDRLLIGVLNREEFSTRLVTIEGEGETTLVEDIQGVVAFNWSPDGEYIAYRVLNQQGYSALSVINAKTGEQVGSSEGENVIAFFWSPDSSKVAYVIPDLRAADTFDTSLQPVQQNTVELAWIVLDVVTGDIQRYSNFTPTSDMVYLFSYFDQFAQSHHLWSPDSRFLVYGENLNGESVISILDTGDANTVPFSLAEGVIGIWSYQ
jgi:TolB protein